MTTTERNTGLGRDEPKANAPTTSPTVEQKAADVVERLLATDLVDNSHGGGKFVRRNPDGPEAAALIERLSAEREGLVGAAFRAGIVYAAEEMDALGDPSCQTEDNIAVETFAAAGRWLRDIAPSEVDTAIAAFRAALSPPAAALAPRVEGWQDIATLTDEMKDGVNRFLVSYTDGVVRVCRWLDNSHTEWPWKGISPTEQIPMRCDAKATLWMPLPQSPTPADTDEGAKT